MAIIVLIVVVVSWVCTRVKLIKSCALNICNKYMQNIQYNILYVSNTSYYNSTIHDIYLHVYIKYIIAIVYNSYKTKCKALTVGRAEGGCWWTVGSFYHRGEKRYLDAEGGGGF